MRPYTDPSTPQHCKNSARLSWRRFLALALLGSAIGWVTIPATAQNSNTFKTRLAPMPRDGRNSPQIDGLGQATVTLAGSQLSVNATFQGLPSAATTARLMQSAFPGMHGNAVADLTISKATSGTISGTVTLNAAQVTALREHRLYIRVDSQQSADGALWGWLY